MAMRATGSNRPELAMDYVLSHPAPPPGAFVLSKATWKRRYLFTWFVSSDHLIEVHCGDGILLHGGLLHLCRAKDNPAPPSKMKVKEMPNDGCSI